MRCGIGASPPCASSSDVALRPRIAPGLPLPEGQVHWLHAHDRPQLDFCVRPALALTFFGG